MRPRRSRFVAKCLAPLRLCFRAAVQMLEKMGVNQNEINKLVEAGVTTIGTILKRTSKELQAIKGMSEARIEKVRRALSRALRETPRSDRKISRSETARSRSSGATTASGGSKSSRRSRSSTSERMCSRCVSRARARFFRATSLDLTPVPRRFRSRRARPASTTCSAAGSTPERSPKSSANIVRGLEQRTARARALARGAVASRRRHGQDPAHAHGARARALSHARARAPIAPPPPACRRVGERLARARGVAGASRALSAPSSSA